MKWPFSKSAKRQKELETRILSLRQELAKVKGQRDKVKAARQSKTGSAASSMIGAAHAAQIDDLVTRLTEMTKERNLFRHLHQTLQVELETTERNTLPTVYDPPMPSSDLRFRIGGQRAIWTFLHIGKTVAADLQRLAGEAGRDLEEFSSVLDFGAGCGRVLRQLPEIFPHAKIHAADVDPEAMAWCSTNLPFLASATTLPLHPPSPLATAQFDFIFAISVFTHLPLAVQQAWFAELRRISKPGALLILSYMPDSTAAECFTPDMALEDVDGFSYYKTTPTEGLPDYYHVSYHTEAAIHRLAGEHFKVLFTRPKAINDHQYAVVCTV